ncbi:hypothetical protein HUF15_30660 [Streptomyces samsunensis]|uniref:hypothetical protein n=1 Tax=Streptomyces malaysiensis TaxID=92644 RepID=UPI0015837082|nr:MULTISPECIES: hypothetical protein [Streptomyces]MCC4319556.1 hypothetical protein [Streptomyces malaysiensis]MCQ6248558.1 hypothetical protein [Streptomyces malaysiensis]NUH41047.1 hypothetical protein [Streptomyces samsunensis]WHX18787.1 hypothetical protein QFW82_17870 [Streptomyces sp. NA07423]
MTAPHSLVYQEYYTRTPFQLLTSAGWKRLVAFRADESGITLGGAAVRYHRFLAVVPWRDIEAVVVWATQTRTEKPVPYISLKLRPGVPAPPGPNRKLTQQFAAGFAPHLEYEVVRNSRRIVLWKVDQARLTAAVQAFAPQVQLRVHPVHRERPGQGGAVGRGSGASIFDILP